METVVITPVRPVRSACSECIADGTVCECGMTPGAPMKPRRTSTSRCLFLDPIVLSDMYGGMDEEKVVCDKEKVMRNEISIEEEIARASWRSDPISMRTLPESVTILTCGVQTCVCVSVRTSSVALTPTPHASPTASTSESHIVFSNFVV